MCVCVCAYKKSYKCENTIPDSCDSRGFRLDSAVNSVIDAIGPIESVTSLRMQFPSICDLVR